MNRALWKYPPVRRSRRLAYDRRDAERSEIKTYVRRGVIGLNALHTRVQVHNGIRFVPLNVTEQHLGFKYGAFAATRRRAVVKKRGRGAPRLKR